MIGLSTLPLQTRTETERQYSSFAPSLEEQVELFRTRLRVDGVDSIMLRTRSTALTGERPSIGVPCAAGISQFAIKWNGEMIPCSGFEFVTERPLDAGFSAAWQDMHIKALNYRLPVECTKCDIYDACTHCPAVHWQIGGEGHVNPHVCEEGRRMLAEGIRNS
jgi:radical SAM protein with 4Fe4S-binding SPASM domain